MATSVPARHPPRNEELDQDRQSHAGAIEQEVAHRRDPGLDEGLMPLVRGRIADREDGDHRIGLDGHRAVPSAAGHREEQTSRHPSEEWNVQELR